MPAFNQILNEYGQLAQADPDTAIAILLDKYLNVLQSYTGRNVIAYYSGFLMYPDLLGIEINDDDKNGFMSAGHGLNVAHGLDLVLHTPGGDIAAAEAIVDYLHSKFGRDIRAIVPHLAMSSGTMIACACKEIVMGRQSNLGPTDPQFRGVPAHGVIEEFQTARKDIKKDPSAIPLWQTIVGKYHPTFLGECRHAIKWSKQIVRDWLRDGMFAGDAQRVKKSRNITNRLANHALNRTHNRHISITDCKKMGLKIVEMEADNTLQDNILSIHHAFMIAISSANARVTKIIRNHSPGNGYFRSAGARPQ